MDCEMIEEIARKLIAVHQKHVPTSSALVAYRAGAGPATTYWNALAQAAYSVMAGRIEERWQPIETAPKDGSKRLLYFPAIPGLDGLAEHICIREDNGGPYRHPTYWQPLPEPPRAVSPSNEEAGDE